MDCAVEEEVVLEYDADVGAQPRWVDVRKIDIVQEDLAFLRDIEALDELGQRRLAGARCS